MVTFPPVFALMFYSCKLNTMVFVILKSLSLTALKSRLKTYLYYLAHIKRHY